MHEPSAEHVLVIVHDAVKELSLSGRDGVRFSPLGGALSGASSASSSSLRRGGNSPNDDNDDNDDGSSPAVEELPLVPVRFRPATKDDRERYQSLRAIARKKELRRQQTASADGWHKGGRKIAPDRFELAWTDVSEY